MVPWARYDTVMGGNMTPQIQGLSEVELVTSYVDYRTRDELLKIRRVLMQHDVKEEIILFDIRYYVSDISTNITMDAIERTITLLH
jgi:hypothetical protein